MYDLTRDLTTQSCISLCTFCTTIVRGDWGNIQISPNKSYFSQMLMGTNQNNQSRKKQEENFANVREWQFLILRARVQEVLRGAMQRGWITCHQPICPPSHNNILCICFLFCASQLNFISFFYICPLLLHPYHLHQYTNQLYIV